jgi:hypothetical protein
MDVADDDRSAPLEDLVPLRAGGNSRSTIARSLTCVVPTSITVRPA